MEEQNQNLEEQNQNLEEEKIIRPEDSPYSPLYNPKNQKKSGNRITIILVVLLLVILCAGLIAAISRLVESAMHEMGEYALTGKSITEKIEEYFDKEGITDSEDEIEAIIPDEEDGEYVPSKEDAYYLCLADAIRTDLSYQVKRETYDYEDADSNVSIHIEYPVINGADFNNQDKLNSYMQDAAMYYLKNYANHPEKGTVTDCSIDVSTYVTYMDEDILSIVLDENFSMSDLGQVDLFCVNIDVSTGQLLESNKILHYTEALAKEFREMSDYQNGEAEAVSALSDEDIADFLSDETSCIAFYTPVGMEIGYNYTMDSSSGWITATIKDYEKYIRKM